MKSSACRSLCDQSELDHSSVPNSGPNTHIKTHIRRSKLKVKLVNDLSAASFLIAGDMYMYTCAPQACYEGDGGAGTRHLEGSEACILDSPSDLACQTGSCSLLRT